jgi:hypothetical protein
LAGIDEVFATLEPITLCQTRQQHESALENFPAHAGAKYGNAAWDEAVDRVLNERIDWFE